MMDNFVLPLFTLLMLRSTAAHNTCGASVPKDCAAVSLNNAKTWNTTGGVFEIYPGDSGRKIKVYCDLTTDGGGWTVFQRRTDGSVDFYRNWADYVIGFGDPAGEFWMGLEKLHSLTKDGVELRIDMEDWEGNAAYAYYTWFSIGDGSSFYRLSFGGYSGTAGDSLFNSASTHTHRNMGFSTVDQDHDRYSGNCAERGHGGWWYNACKTSGLNGFYHTGGDYAAETNTGIEWYTLKNKYYYSLKFVEMKIRPKLTQY